MLPKRKESEKTKMYNEWLTNNVSRFNFRDDLEQEFIEQFPVCSKQFVRIYKKFCDNKLVGQERKEADYSKVKDKLVAGTKDKCYFCGSKENVVKHHINYKVNKVVYVCKSCHNKVHIVFKEYHKDMKENKNEI